MTKMTVTLARVDAISKGRAVDPHITNAYWVKYWSPMCYDYLYFSVVNSPDQFRFRVHPRTGDVALEKKTRITVTSWQKV